MSLLKIYGASKSGCEGGAVAGKVRWLWVIAAMLRVGGWVGLEVTIDCHVVHQSWQGHNFGYSSLCRGLVILTVP